MRFRRNPGNSEPQAAPQQLPPPTDQPTDQYGRTIDEEATQNLGLQIRNDLLRRVGDNEALLTPYSDYSRGDRSRPSSVGSLLLMETADKYVDLKRTHKFRNENGYWSDYPGGQRLVVAVRPKEDDPQSDQADNIPKNICFTP